MSDEPQLKVLREHGRREIFFCAALASEGDRLFAGASNGNLYALDPLADKPEFTALPGHASFVTGLARAGECLVSGGYDCRLIWRGLDGQVVHQADDAHSRWIRKVVASPDGRRIASVGDDMVCRLWEAPSGKLLQELRGHEVQTPHHFPSMLYTCAFSGDGQRLATADKAGRICVWDAAAGTLIKQLDAPGFYTWDPRQRIHSIGGIRSLAFAEGDRGLLAGGIGTIGNIDHLDGPARVEWFDLESGASRQVFSGDAKGLVEQLVPLAGGRWLLGLGGDNAGFCQLYDLLENKVTRSDKAPMHVHAAVLDPARGRLLAVGHGRIVAWQLESQA